MTSDAGVSTYSQRAPTVIYERRYGIIILLSVNTFCYNILYSHPYGSTAINDDLARSCIIIIIYYHMYNNNNIAKHSWSCPHNT